jgi:transcriptional regulator with XRE-family HTH domain
LQSSRKLDKESIMMDEPESAIEHRVAARLRGLRAELGLTLGDLAQRSGVSRSMISLIERAESSPTASVLDRLAASLGVSIAAFFAGEERADAPPVARHAAQPEWRDPATGYVRRNLSPPGFASAIELVEVVLPPGVRVAYDSGFRVAALDQQVWVLAGMVEVTVGGDAHLLGPGDCLAMRVDRPTAFHNRRDGIARYLVAITTDAARAKAGARAGT